MTDEVRRFLDTHPLNDPEDMVSLLAAADFVRGLLTEGRREEVCDLLRHVIGENCFDALTWVIETVQESFVEEKGSTGDGTEDEITVPDLVCEIGRSVNDYDGFVACLGVSNDPVQSDAVKVYGSDGEVQSFFYVSAYETAYDALYLVTMENVDTMDNDYILYQLLFTTDVGRFFEGLSIIM